MFLRNIGLGMLAAAMATTVFTSGCSVHAGYYYDPYYHDYHRINGEVVYYNQWETDTHREHKELKDRDKNEQKEYWDWRHKNNGH